ncbi:MAG TPA: hypothetical protein VH374_26355 [Polyangia bacterium]|jgi:hypothetical protein|nr:hypothetical protein [Polyangia bacterium]
MADERRLCVVPLPIIRDRALSDHAKLCAVALGAFMFRDGSCSPGIAAVAALRNCSARHCQRGLDELIAAGHLTMTRRQRQPAMLTWRHPLTGHNGVHSKDALTGQKSTLDRTKKGVSSGLDRTHDVRTQIENSFNENVNEGTAGHTDRTNSTPRRRVDRDASPQPLQNAIGEWLAQNRPAKVAAS